MKIIQLLFSLASGGAEKFVVNLSNELLKRGHDVTVCILRSDSDPKMAFNKQFLDPQVKFHSLDFSSGFSFKKVSLVEDYLEKELPDVVHCHLNVIPFIYRFAFLHKNIRFVHTIHNIAEKASGLKVQYYMNKYFYKNNILRPVTISAKCDESFIEYFQLKNAVCIDNGCPTVKASNEFKNVKLEIASYKKTENTPVFIHVARCDQQKNQRLLIEAFNQLYKEGIDFTLLILGIGFFDERNQILREIACHNIHFLGEKKNVCDYLLCSDAFCLSSIYEGLPIALIEAMSCGLTSICTPVGGIPDVIADGCTGYLTSDLSLDSYISTIKRYFKSPLDRLNIISEYHKKYSIEECTNRYLAVYK